MKVYPPILKTKHIPKNIFSMLMSLHSMSLVLFFFWLKIGQKLLDSLAETWDFFFCDVLTMLQAIFHPVQVQSSHPVWNNWSDISYSSGVCSWYLRGRSHRCVSWPCCTSETPSPLTWSWRRLCPDREPASLPPSSRCFWCYRYISCERSSHTVMSWSRRL